MFNKNELDYIEYLINIDVEKLRKQKTEGIQIPKGLIESKSVLIKKVRKL